MVISLIGPWRACYRIPPRPVVAPCKTFGLHLTSNLGIGGIRNARTGADLFGYVWLGVKNVVCRDGIA
jgi:hypothetical protein